LELNYEGTKQQPVNICIMPSKTQHMYINTVTKSITSGLDVSTVKQPSSGQLYNISVHSTVHTYIYLVYVLHWPDDDCFTVETCGPDVIDIVTVLMYICCVLDGIIHIFTTTLSGGPYQKENQQPVFRLL